MHIPSRSALTFLVVLAAAACLTFGMDPASAGDEGEDPLQHALERFVSQEGGPPGIIVVVARGQSIDVHTAGYANLESRRPIRIHDHMRLASVAKAFNGAAALSLVASGQLSLDDTIRRWLPDLPQTWWPVTLGQLLNHTSGILDFSREDAFLDALRMSLQVPPSPRALLAFIGGKPPSFDAGTQYRYSNSDNIIVGLMVEAATSEPYEDVLKSRVYRPLKLTGTSLPNDSDMPRPYVHGYDVQDNPPSDVSKLFAAGWTWASGGIVSTPADAILFVRGYVGGALIDQKTRAAQFQFRDGKSEPPGPGMNSAGLALFRYETTCGTVYGHTGNTAGYTQFIAATADGRRSVVVSINGQITPGLDEKRFAELRRIYELAVCAALRQDILNLP
ncbi:MAG TPA: serine hydrolase domain-containing protein [Nitrospira sp.]|nr:serine hydrolase domain-containing protein [Nitrospira sp.]